MNGIDNLLFNLKIISKISDNCKVSRDSNGDLSIDKIGYTTSVKRYLMSDSRQRGVRDINNIITDAISRTNDIINSVVFQKIEKSENVFIKNKLDTEYNLLNSSLFSLITELEKCATGLVNLKKNYASDFSTVSKIDIIISRIEHHVFLLNKKYGDNF